MSTPKTDSKTTKKRDEWPCVRFFEGRTKPWGVDGRQKENGKPVGERHFFETAAQADAKAEELRTGRKHSGREGTIPAQLRVDALWAEKELGAVNSNIREAVKYFLAHARPAGGKQKVRDGVEAFLREKADAGCRPEYLAVQGYVLRSFAEAHPALIHEITAEQAGTWIRGEGLVPRTRKNRHQDLQNLFGFALRKGWIASNPILTLKKAIVDETAPGILTPAQAEELMRLTVSRGSAMTAFCALGLFAGIRTDELGRLQWEKVSLDKRQIEIGAEIAKKRTARYVPISPTLAAWLTAEAKDGGPIAPPKVDSQWLCLRAQLSFPWLKNAMRHSFASYHFATHSNAPLTAAVLGHHGDTGTLFEHYRALATKADAKKYWAILPK